MFYLLILLLQMKLIRHISDLNKAIKNVQKIGFVPTMGGLHKGHESLIKKSQKKCNKTLVSIFVNPKQFNNVYDYKTYPRNQNKDLKILKKLKVNFVFLPSSKEIYKEKMLTKFKLKKSEKILCAKFRKNHFEGVLNIMNRFIRLISPKYVFMGEKDFQQFFLIKKNLERELNTKIFLCKTVRDKNKIALSTRNFNLNINDIKKVRLVSKKMIDLKKRIKTNKNNANYLINDIKARLIKKYKINIEYLEIRNTNNLSKRIKNQKYKIFIAYYLNKIRLIDNY